MVYGVLRLINFAHGDVYMVGAMAAYYTAHWLGFSARPRSRLSDCHDGDMGFCGGLGALIEFVPTGHYAIAPGSPCSSPPSASPCCSNSAGNSSSAPIEILSQLIESRSLFRAGGVVLTNIDALVIVVSLLLMVVLRGIVMHTRIGLALRASVSVSTPRR